jgi:hypothetical protein
MKSIANNLSIPLIFKNKMTIFYTIKHPPIISVKSKHKNKVKKIHPTQKFKKKNISSSHSKVINLLNIPLLT